MYHFPELYGKTNELERENNQLFYYGVKEGDSKLGNRRILYCGVWTDCKQDIWCHAEMALIHWRKIFRPN